MCTKRFFVPVVSCLVISWLLIGEFVVRKVSEEESRGRKRRPGLRILHFVLNVAANADSVP